MKQLIWRIRYLLARWICPRGVVEIFDMEKNGEWLKTNAEWRNEHGDS